MTPYSDLVATFGRIGLLSFGGPAAQIALMHREFVERRRWIAEGEFLPALSFCLLLPGPEAMQLATWCGWRLRGTPGGLIAGLLFVIPGALLTFALALAYLRFGDLPAVQAAFLGIKAAVVAIVIEALVKVSKKALSGPEAYAIAAAAFVALAALPFPAVILAAGVWGYVRSEGAGETAPDLPPANTAQTVIIWLVVWLAPLAILYVLNAQLLFEIGAFFARLALFTFGGAYAVLAWMAHEAVETEGWLTAGQMLDALGLAETTPGPLILVTQFVGILAAAPAGQAVAGGLVTLHATFAPCFLWIFAGAPHIARITARPRLKGALAAISAAVVGVIASLSLWFALHVAFGTVHDGLIPLPDLSTIDPVAIGLMILSAILLLVLRLPLLLVLALAAPAGLALSPLGLLA